MSFLMSFQLLLLNLIVLTASFFEGATCRYLFIDSDCDSNKPEIPLVEPNRSLPKLGQFDMTSSV